MNVLVLGGTAEARQLVCLLAPAPATRVVLSLAGHTSEPSPVPCPVRTGGFGGTDGLAAHLRAEAVDALVDATHPFAATMPANAARAAGVVGIPWLRLVRPAWEPQPGDRWVDASDLADARQRLVEGGSRRVLLTTGRLHLGPFASMPWIHFVVRCVEDPGPLPLADATVLRGRGPFGVGAEAAALRDHDIDTLVTKNSGGSGAKLVAARESGVGVVMVRRPPAGAPGPWVATAAEAFAWLAALRADGSQQPPQ